MMLIQSGSVVQILSGRDTGWNPQRRDDGSIPFHSIVRRHRAHMALGVLTLFAGMLISPSLVVWMSPTIAGLILAIPLSWASGQLWIGVALRRLGLLTTPEETSPPAIVQRANALSIELAAPAMTATMDCARSMATRRFAPSTNFFCPRPRAAGAAKSMSKRRWRQPSSTMRKSLEEVIGWLKPKERMALLNDRALISLLVRLPPTRRPRRKRGRITQPAATLSA